MQDGKLPVFVEENILQQSVSELAPFAVLMGAIAPTLPLYTISLGPLYHEILRPPLTCVRFYLQVQLQCSLAKQQTLGPLLAQRNSNLGCSSYHTGGHGKNKSPPNRCLETEIHSADILLSFNHFS